MRLTLVALCCLLAPIAHAQRAAAGPIDVALLADAAHAYQYRVSVVARVDAELVADVRYLHLEVRPTGSRRTLACDSPSRPARVPTDAIRTLSPGQTWTETFDVRTICWGRALDALVSGAELGGRLGTTRSHSGARAAGTSASFRPASIPFSAVAMTTPPAPPAGDVRVALGSFDATTGSHVVLHVTTRSTRAIRAWIRPDRFGFRVVSPDGATHRCALDRSVGAPIADLFSRVTARSGPTFSLDARAFCGEHVFDAAGIYEVTPTLVLDVDGTQWHLDTPLGTFEGAPATVRVRTATRGGPA